HQHETQSEYDLAATVGGHRAPPDFMPDCDVRHVRDANRNPLMCRDDNLPDLVEPRGAPQSLDEQHPSVLADISATHVEVIVLDGGHDRFKGQPVLDEPFRVDANLVLLFIPPPTVDLG